jgi:signal transduction histidine kinase
MPAQTSRLGAAPAVDHSASIEMEDAALAKIRLDGDELQGCGLPSPASSQTSVNPDRAGDITAIGWLSTSILHDLRSPASAISAAAEILVHTEPLPTGVKRLATNIYRAASRVQELLTDLNSVIHGNRSTFEMCELRETLAPVLEAALEALGNKGVQLVLDIPRGIVLPLQRTRIQRVFTNLVSNAVEALSQGGEIHISAKITDDRVDVDLKDTGPGIPLSIRDRLFEPFVTTGKDGGWGLGLALSRQAILDHGGEIWAEPGAGSRFVIRLPLNPDPHAETCSAATSAER